MAAKDYIHPKGYWGDRGNPYSTANQSGLSFALRAVCTAFPARPMRSHGGLAASRPPQSLGRRCADLYACRAFASPFATITRGIHVR